MKLCVGRLSVSEGKLYKVGCNGVDICLGSQKIVHGGRTDEITLAKMVQEYNLLVFRVVTVLWRPCQHLHGVKGQLRVPAVP